MTPARTATLLALSLSASCTTLQQQVALNDSLDREIKAVRMENERLTEQLATCDDGPGPPSLLYTELRQVFPGDEVVVERDGDTTVVRVPGSVLFATNSVRVRAESAMVLDLLSTALNLHTDHQVHVLVHTSDAAPSSTLRKRYPTNWDLSVARAVAVARTLIDDYGVAPDRFIVMGQGEFAPLADNSTPEGREANQRVEFHLVPMEETP
ncbi:MAG: OmpA family protein [Alphaproteobacteria bacterium]|nr:OmpA family protein [Alphaproteobacteria bacterium]